MFRLVTTAGLLWVLLTPLTMAQDGDRWRGGDRDRGRESSEGFGRRRGSWGRDGDGPRGRRGFDPVSRLDANQNGVIDQSEIDGIPERFRSMMDARGFHLESGEPVDSVRGRMREQFERERREREREEAGDDRGSDSGRANRSTPPPPFRPRDRVRMTVDLPESYGDIDTDLDGQIGLYEWIVTRRDDLEQFDEIDRNADGMLTPKELVAWDARQTDVGTATLTAQTRERLIIVGAGTGTAAAVSEGRGGRNRSERKEEKERIRQEADSVFSRMDRDDDGTISMDEWQRSRRVRPWFESAGVTIQPMSAKEFSSAWQKLARSRSEEPRRR